tara:strand:- start:10330 stop:10791 length:462 start_codon:yes stop_codon:yes gene_type:complete
MKTGILVGDLGPSQLSYYIIKNCNKTLENNNKDDFIVFVENLSKFAMKPNFGLMSIDEVWSFYDGLLVATSISTSLQVKKATNNSKKCFYVWDLEWTRPHGRDFLYNIEAFKDIDLIARSKEHAKAIKNYCNRDVVGIVEDFNLEQLYKVTGQ